MDSDFGMGFVANEERDSGAGGGPKFGISYLVGEGEYFEYEQTDFLIHPIDMPENEVTEHLVQRLIEGGIKSQDEIDQAFDDERLIKVTFDIDDRIDYGYVCIIDLETPVVEFVRILLPWCRTEEEARNHSIKNIIGKYNLDEGSEYWNIDKIEVYKDLTLPTKSKRK